MQRRHLYIAWAVLGLALIGMIFAWGRLHKSSDLGAPMISKEIKPTRLRGPVPQFSATTLDGKTITSAEFKGKPTVVDFFATWCGPCKAEAAGIGRLARQFGDKVRFVGVDIDDTSQARSRAFVRKHGWNFPVIWDPDEKLVAPFKVGGKPMMILVDGNGKLALGALGVHSMAEYAAAIHVLQGKAM